MLLLEPEQFKYVIKMLLKDYKTEGIIIDFIKDDPKNYIIYLDSSENVKIKFYYRNIRNGEYVLDCGVTARQIDKNKALELMNRFAMSTSVI